MDFIAIDFETATASTNSACSIGLALVAQERVVKTQYFLIQPPTLLFEPKNIEIHGILPEQVQDKPKFPALWEKIQPYFNGACPIVAHNAQFDLSVLMESLTYYGLSLPQFPYFDSIPFSTYTCGKKVPRSLDARAKYFGISLENHHNAAADAVACAQIVLESVKQSRWDSFPTFCDENAIQMKPFQALHPQKAVHFPSRKKRIDYSRFEKIDYQHIVVSSSPVCDSIFKGKTVVITGEFIRHSRSELVQMLANLGATVKSGVTRKTDYLLVGKQDKRLVGENGLSSKEEKAYALMEKGLPIQILKESVVEETLAQAAAQAAIL